MTTQAGPAEQADPQSRLEVEPGIRPTRPVTVWAALGALILAAYAALVIAWLVSGEASPVPTGPDSVPGFMKVSIRVAEVIAVVSALGFFWFKVYKPRRRDGRFTFDGLLILALPTIFMQDLIHNWNQMNQSFNAYFVNLGSWYRFVPGWAAPNTTNVTEPLLFILPLYVGFHFVSILMVNWMMRQMARRWPSLRSGSMFAICVVGIAFADFVGEALVMMPLGLYTYTNPIPWLTINHGHYYQWPVYQGVLAGIFFSILGYLRWYRNDKGESWPERGVSELRLSKKRRTVVRFLALVAFVNVFQLMTFHVPWVFLGMSSGPTPQDVQSRSYFVGTQCGPGTSYACPDPKVPVPRRHSSHVDPEGNLVGPNGEKSSKERS